MPQLHPEAADVSSNDASAFQSLMVQPSRNGRHTACASKSVNR